MQNPFPGMNPYLEQTEWWHQLHNRLIVAMADDLTPQIAPKYRVSIEERVYTSVDDIFLVGIADVAVAKRNAHDPFAAMRFRDYRLFTIGRVLLFTGGQMQTVVIGWELYERTHSPLELKQIYKLF
jgi:hypothetical protein